MRLLGRARLLALVLVLVLALGGAACVEPLPEEAATSTTEPGTPSPTDPADPTTPTDPGTAEDDPGSALPPGVADALGEIGGRWAVTRGHEVLVVDLADLSEVVVDGSPTSVATQPVWSPDGSLLAWSVLDDGQGRALTQVRRGDGSVPWSTASAYPVADLPGSPAFYLQWSGGASELLALVPSGEGVQDIGALYLDPEGRTFPLVNGGPIWVDWSPDGSRALLHLDDERVGIFDPGSGRAAVVDVLATDQEFVVAPWLDDVTFLAAADGGFASYDDTGERVVELLATADRVDAVLSSDGTQLAFTAVLDGESESTADEAAPAEGSEEPPVARPGDEGEPEAPDEGQGNPSQTAPLRVLDIGTGELTTVTDNPVLAWEWSPDGSTLAYLAGAESEGIATVAYRQDEPTGLRWYFWKDATLVNATSPFEPSSLSLGAYLPFFEQYTTSHTRWSPDGRAFVFAGTVVDDAGPRTGVHVQFVDALADSFWITNGDEAFWSPNGSGGGSGSIL